MIKHKSYSGEELALILTKDIDYIKEFRFNCIISHNYNEYYINEIIKLKFSNPNKIYSWRFSQKLDLLEAMGIFDDTNKLKEQLEWISKIRNYYAHTLEDEMSENIKKYIENLWKIYKVFHSNRNDYSFEEKFRKVKGIVLGILISVYSNIKLEYKKKSN
jgi:hypothetical protein